MDKSIQGFNIGSYLPIILIGVVGYFILSKKEGGGNFLGMTEGYDKKSEKYSTLSTKYGKLANVYGELFKADNKLSELKSNAKNIQ